ncbi:hypothetical protein D3C74_351550 [compost metagenome]
MNIYIVHFFFFGQIQHSEQVVDVTMYAAIGQQAVEMKLFTALFRFANSFDKCFIVVELAVTNGFGDTGQILVYDPAGTNVQVTYLGVPHLAFR